MTKHKKILSRFQKQSFLNIRRKTISKRILLLILLAVFILPGLTACQAVFPSPAPAAAPPGEMPALPSYTPLFTPAELPTALPVNPTPTPPDLPVMDPAGCTAPIDDYSRHSIHEMVLNQRTLSMLQTASVWMDGSQDYFLNRLTQGSYHDNGAASWGTHAGGGAVDLSVLIPGTFQIDSENISRMIRSLRAAGFAVWLRDMDELSSGSAIHLHALAIGDMELSDAALAQINSPEGYFAGNNGLPPQKGGPLPDRHGPPVICTWMIEQGITESAPPDTELVPWRKQLYQTAEKYKTASQSETEALAARLPFYPGTSRGWMDMDGTLIIRILHESGFLHPLDAPLYSFSNFRLSHLEKDWRFRQQFNAHDFEQIDQILPLDLFDFSAWPLQTGDVLILKKETMPVALVLITQTAAQGQVSGFLALQDENNHVTFQNLVLINSGTPQEGLFANPSEIYHLLNFSVLRRKDRGLPAGSLYTYRIQPADTLALLAAKYNTTPQAILEKNPGYRNKALIPGEWILIPSDHAEDANP